jgi:hypothetical protein
MKRIVELAKVEVTGPVGACPIREQQAPLEVNHGGVERVCLA